MIISDADRACLEVIASWLRLEDDEPAQVDVTLLFGGSLPDAWDAVAHAAKRGVAGTVVLVGGVGHTTDALRAVLRGGGHEADAATEADLMATYLRDVHGLADLLVERESTNCGNNVTLARDVVARAGLRPRSVALVQDPTMQRRMDAVARLVWDTIEVVNRPGPDSRGWPLRRWVALVMGEVPRLRDDAEGYGPRGRGYLAHVDVPEEVRAAHARLVHAHPDWGRPAARRSRDPISSVVRDAGWAGRGADRGGWRIGPMSNPPIGSDLMAGPPPTHLPQDPAAGALADGEPPITVVRRLPASPWAWAALAEEAAAGEADAVTTYAYARVGYHRSLDLLRRNGWKGHGPVPWSHEPNRGFLRCLALLAQAAEEIGETDEHQRCADFLRDSSPEAYQELLG